MSEDGVGFTRDNAVVFPGLWSWAAIELTSCATSTPATTRRISCEPDGHLPPTPFRPEIEQLSVGGTVVGMFPEMEYEEATMSHGSWPSSGHHPSPGRGCGLHACALLAVPALWRPHRHLNHQTFCAGLAREQELEHDLQLYRGYEQARRGS